MDFLKEIFGDKAITFDEFSKGVESKKMKLADLSGGAYVSKEKLDAKIEELKTVQASLAEKDAALKKWDGVDLDKLKAENDAKTEELNKQLSALKKQNAVETSLLAENIQDLKAIKAYIDFDTVKVADDGTVTGLKEQVEKLKTEKAFLFKVQPNGQENAEPQKKLTTGVPHDNQPGGNTTSFKDVIAEKMGYKK
jgi:hypothetical protein